MRWCSRCAASNGSARFSLRPRSDLGEPGDRGAAGAVEGGEHGAFGTDAGGAYRVVKRFDVRKIALILSHSLTVERESASERLHSYRRISWSIAAAPRSCGQTRIAGAAQTPSPKPAYRSLERRAQILHRKAPKRCIKVAAQCHHFESLAHLPR